MNDVFGLLDVSGFVVHISRADMQGALDVAAGICLSALYDADVNFFVHAPTFGRRYAVVCCVCVSLTECNQFGCGQLENSRQEEPRTRVAEGSSNLLRDFGQSTSSFIVAGSTGTEQGAK